MRSEKIVFVTYNELVCDIREFIKGLDIGAVAGVPRSGCLVASIISQEMNIPLRFITENGLIDFRLDISRPINYPNKPTLIIDDTSWSGRAINNIRKIVGEDGVIYGAIYSSEKQSKELDVFYKIFYTPYHTFEWNFLKDTLTQDYYIDFDGVLCEDPTCPDDSDEYNNFIKNVRPKCIPKYKVGSIVTARLGKYRGETEKWLKSNGVDYHDLVMSPYSTSEERLRNSGFGVWKAGVYKRAPDHIRLFVESNAQQAEEIFVISKRPVFCTDEMRLYQ